MNKIEIRRPRVEDVEPLNQFFVLVIKDTFSSERLVGFEEEIQSEIAHKRIQLNEDIEFRGAKRYFLIAWVDDKIVGTIAYGPASDFINRCTYGALTHWHWSG